MLHKLFKTMKWDNKLRAWFPATRWGVIITVVVCATLCMAATTQINLTSQVKGILGIVNGGTAQSSFSAGLLRSSGSALSSAELSGDATSSGSNAVTVAKVNGTSVATNAAADQVLLTTASAAASWASVTNCGDSGHALAYSTATHTFSCQAVAGATFADAETPTGAIDGSNVTFNLAHTPSPAGSLELYKNGQQMIAGGADYTLATATITYTSGSKPASGDVHICSYRY